MDIEFGEIVAVLEDGRPCITCAPPYAWLAWGTLTLADPRFLWMSDGLVHLIGGFSYRIIGAEQNYAQLERVA